jgi:hypothetical protein
VYPGRSVTGRLVTGRFVSWRFCNWTFGNWTFCNWTLCNWTFCGCTGQPRGGTSGHDYRPGQPRVDAIPSAGGAVRAVHPDVDKFEPAIHPPRERGGTLEAVAAERSRRKRHVIRIS